MINTCRLLSTRLIPIEILQQIKNPQFLVDQLQLHQIIDLTPKGLETHMWDLVILGRLL
jgi:hypothetical protein